LSDEELRRFYLPDSEFGAHVRGAYPHFQRKMDDLVGEGGWLIDGSMLFKDERDTVYIDACCHFNPKGLRALADLIADEVAQHASSRSTATAD
jgi:hypothetical protein